MSASLVGSEMCIRDSATTARRRHPWRHRRRRTRRGDRCRGRPCRRALYGRLVRREREAMMDDWRATCCHKKGRRRGLGRHRERRGPQ
eukprot:12062861-Alexandrium_andersonii.AAC.1